MALNRTGKVTAFDEKSLTRDISPNSINSNSIPIEKPALTKAEIEKGKQDIETINSDLLLLSTLLGRPVSANDLPSITQQFGGGASVTAGSGSRRRVVPSSTTTSTTSTTTTTTTTAKPAIVKEVELLQSILGVKPNTIQEERRPEYYGKTDDAILATILKQQGIGPTHNNIPIEVR